jgi:hypothetical protein
MATFPTKFANQIEVLHDGIGLRGDESLLRLREKGYSVAVGVTEYFAGAISVMGYQRSIREYCPRDATESRFASQGSTEKWLQKNGGRGMFLLLSGSEDNKQLEGYSWTGIEQCEELPDHPITSAYRIGERSQGKGLGKDFVQAVVSGTNALFADGEGIGLETWKSNPAADMYLKVGFLFIAEAKEDEPRRTLNSDANDGSVLDRRLYMGYPRELLA